MSRGKTFPCGHKGKGQQCQRCAAPSAPAKSPSPGVAPESVVKASEGKLDPKLDKAEWEAAFSADPIDLHDLPTPKLVLRAREILEAIGRGAPWHQFNGKRLQHDRTIISVPLGRRYRILFRTDDGSPQPVEVLSHESYNATKPGRR